MIDLVVGCPVLARSWCLPAWFEAVGRACRRAEVSPEFVFVGDPDHDPETWEVIDHLVEDRPLTAVVVTETRTTDDRDWGRDPARFHRMVELRNELLAEVRAINPQWFLSLDSDIVLHPDALVLMLDTLTHYDAVGGKCYMSANPNDTSYPSYALLPPGGGLLRPDSNQVFKVDALMAIKLLGRRAFRAVEYEWHHHGEDIGWSLACRRAGLTLGWNGSACSKHLMNRDMLDQVDARVGW